MTVVAITVVGAGGQTTLRVELPADAVFWWVKYVFFSRSGEVVWECGPDRDGEGEVGGESDGCSADVLLCDKEGGTVMEMNVSTKRELMTFSNAFWELSGNSGKKGTEIVEDEGMTDEVCANRILMDDAIELVRGLLDDLIDGVPVEGKARLEDPTFVVDP